MLHLYDLFWNRYILTVCSAIILLKFDKNKDTLITDKAIFSTEFQENWYTIVRTPNKSHVFDFGERHRLDLYLFSLLVFSFLPLLT